MIKSYAAHGPKEPLKPYEYEPGPLGKDEVEISVDYCGICHSDLSVMNNDWGITEYPVVPGHEVVGKISACGENVKHLKMGQTVGLGWHAGYCDHCSSCFQGDHNLCQQATATIVGHHGGFADKVRASQSSVVPLPEGIDLESCGPLFCGGITVFNPLIQFNIKPTDRVGVIGIGGLGHIAVQFYQKWGCEVVAFSSNDSKKNEILNLGATHVVNSKDSVELEKWAGQLDFIISTVNVSLDWGVYFNLLKPKGRFHYVGATLEPIEVQAFSLIPMQRSISGSPVGSPSTIAMMLDFAKRHQIKPIVQTFPMSKVNDAIKVLESGQARYRLVLCKD